MFRLDQRRILLTGAAGYLGRAMAAGLAEAGAEIILVGRTLLSLEALVTQLTKTGAGGVHPFAANLEDEGGVAQLLAYLEMRFPRLDGLVNNAYAGRTGPVAAVGSHDFAAASRLNLTAPFLLAKGCAPMLAAGAAERGGTSSIVNIASMYGKVSPDPDMYGRSGNDNPAHYGATKAGLIQLTRYLACNLDPVNIRVNSLSPGPFPNPEKAPPKAFLADLKRRVPMGRVAHAKEIAGPLVFLLSEAASYISGADLAVDGGWTAW